MQDTFESLRPRLEDYLRSRGINPEKRFRCLNPDHFDRRPSMSYDPKRYKAHCFACGADYDLFDLLILDGDARTPRDALAEASRRYGNGSVRPAAESGCRSYRKEKQPPPSGRTPEEAAPGKRNAGENAAYIEECALRRGETGYFARRGISETTAERFGLGYDPERRCVVLPSGDGDFIRRSVEGKQYLNEKGRPSPLFQKALLGGKELVFLTEGTFDALSAEELGCRAAALNGSGNREKAAAILRQLPERQSGMVLLLPDADDAGDAWASALAEEFPWLYRCPPVPIGKDLNESLCADREETRRYLVRCLLGWEASRPPAYETLSAAGRMEALERYIDEQARRPAWKTGFEPLDAALDGGLYPGLYVLGAVSSLGKTAFCMQVADQLAQAGTGVLVFSLEMSAYELMARSISRETFLSDRSRGRRLAKTVRGVLDGKRYQAYSRAEMEHLNAAKERYAAYAGHIWFREGDHETGMDYIRREILRHIEETGERPVVLLDYLQIVAPADVHFTDKQNLDRTVCALKKLSREKELAILAVSSFNRENYNVAATMAAFKESGGIDYSADVLLGLQARGAESRSFNIDEEKRKDPRELELKILKNRTAALGSPIPFRYYPAFSYFSAAP